MPEEAAERIEQWKLEAGDVRCGTCKFFDGDGCRRRSPTHRSPHEFCLIAMLQAIAIAQLARIPEASVNELIEHGRIDEDVFKEVTEHYKPDRWPFVDEYDWCGEWEEGYDEARQDALRGLRNSSP